jgi:hypothetical protein
VTRLGHEHCDITEGELLDITPLVVDGKKLVTLYDKDLTEGINLLIGELIGILRAIHLMGRNHVHFKSSFDWESLEFSPPLWFTQERERDKKNFFRM